MLWAVPTPNRKGWSSVARLRSPPSVCEGGKQPRTALMRSGHHFRRMAGNAAHGLAASAPPTLTSVDTSGVSFRAVPAVGRLN